MGDICSTIAIESVKQLEEEMDRILLEVLRIDKEELPTAMESGSLRLDILPDSTRVFYYHDRKCAEFFPVKVLPVFDPNTQNKVFRVVRDYKIYPDEWESHYSRRPIECDEETEQYIMELDRRRRERKFEYHPSNEYNPLPQSDEELQRRLMRQVREGATDGEVYPANEEDVSPAEEDA